MKMIGTPEGSSDRLFSECASWRRVQGALTGLFKHRGYSEIMTPETEYYDLFVQAGYPLPQESMMKVIDRSGRILSMRPDNTTPIARVMASQLRTAPLPQRLYYNQNVYRSDDAHTGHSAQIAQCGVELIGAAGMRADLEVICMAIQAIEASGVQDFQLELGCVDYFAGLAELLDAPEDTVSAMRRSIEEKNFTAYAELLAPYSDSEAGRALSKLNRMFGGTEVLQKARKSCPSQRAMAALDYLQALYERLSEAGLAEHVQFDLGLVQRLDYYTGVVFRAFGQGSGSVVLSGGRYDKLIGRLGYDVPAIGFAVDVQALSQCLSPVETTRKQTVVYYEDGFLGKALACIAAEPKGTAVLSTAETEEAAFCEARSLGAEVLVVLGAEGERRVAL
ncbi:MAG: ATP phosphoribosyltransferase regulatory subunit [Ruminococcaceae bacterium]|nr:ATP phosphoribosyltransferase regulatory subunit [Oscillospiraceae bacterium]